MTFVYDGTFEGFLTLIHYSYTHKKSPQKIVRDPHAIDLLDTAETIVTDPAYAKKVFAALKEKFTSKNFNRIFHIFMCDTRDFEKALYDYIVLGFRAQKHLDDINYPSIYYVMKLEREYLRHLHRMYGFVRFEELEDATLYAKIESKFNILPLLGKHFVRRLDGCDFILHDLQRSLAYLQNGEGSVIREVVAFERPKYAPHEEKFQKLWKTFFKAVSIPERKNPKLQRSWVPLLYRKYMTEFSPADPIAKKI